MVLCCVQCNLLSYCFCICDVLVALSLRENAFDFVGPHVVVLMLTMCGLLALRVRFGE